MQSYQLQKLLNFDSISDIISVFIFRYTLGVRRRWLMTMSAAGII